MIASFSPLFFGGHHGPLYGVHHAPDPAMDRSHGVLFLAPLGQDYKRCHKALQKLARDLAGAGFHVLRFDYAGSGDSAAPASWSLDSWREDAHVALEQLRTLGKVNELSAFGVRLGAGIATQLDAPLTNLVLWDPIGDGPAYLEELETLNQELLHQFRHAYRRGSKVATPPNQLLGHAFPPAMKESLLAYTLQEPSPEPARRALWIDVETTPATANFDPFRGRLAGEEQHCRVETRCGWRSLEEIGNIIMGQPVTRQVSQHLTGAR